MTVTTKTDTTGSATRDPKQHFSDAVNGQVVSDDNQPDSPTQPTSADRQQFQRAATQQQQTQENLLLSLLAYMFSPDNQQAGFPAPTLEIFAAILGFGDPSALTQWMDDVNDSELKVTTALQTLPDNGSSVDHNRLKQFAHEKPIIFERSADRNEMLSKYPGISNLLATIRDGEHSRTGDIVYNTAFGNRTVDFTHMTVDQVLQWQLDNNPPGKGTAAVGAYQIIRPTLLELKKNMSLTGNELMDKNLQDEMGLVLLEKRGLFDGLTTSKLALNISKEWASFPKDESGRSYYGGDGINSAQIDYKTVVTAINGVNEPATITNDPTTMPS